MQRDDLKELSVTLEEIRAFRKEMLLMHGVLATDMVESHQVIKEVSELFVQKGLEKVWLDKLLALFVGTEMEEEREILLSYVLDELDQKILSKEEDLSGQKIHILLGATGVGKTTLVGKLGARYTYLLDHSYRVAFCNMDRHKLGAKAQLVAYSDAMEIPLIDLDSIKEGYDRVMVDTSGLYDQSLVELKDLLNQLSSTDYEIELSLVLSATAKESDMVHLMEIFDAFEIGSFIFTKLDETDNISDMIRFLMRYDKPITYLSVGQEIPEDLMVASNEYILKKFMTKREEHG
jgi:flagellar biosynthesis protein FlhF